MHDDLLFHITTREDWKSFQKNGKYKPQTLEEQGFIHCSRGDQVEATANRLFSNKQEILLLVIDVSALVPNVKYELDEERGEKFPHIYGPLNIDAVIDKIRVDAGKNKAFEISFRSHDG